MAIADNLNRIIQAKADIKSAIENKGVSVGDITIDGYAAKIAEIPQEGGGSSAKIRLADTGIKLGASTFSEVPDCFDFEGVTDMSLMFEHCHNLDTIDLSFIDFSKVTDMTGMLYNTRLKSIDVSDWDVSNCSSIRELFCNSTDITSLDLSSWEIKEGLDIANFCTDCYSLTDLDISTWDLSKTINGIYFGWGVPLVNFRCGYNLKNNLDISSQSNLTLESLLSIMNGLYDFTGNGETPSTNLYEGELTSWGVIEKNLNEEQIAIATNKGWTIW